MPPLFYIDRGALRDAGERIGLRHDVRVHITYYKDRRMQGRYVDLRDGIHRIAVAGDQSFRQASRTIWHELGHAAQVERLGGLAALDAAIEAELRAAGIRLSSSSVLWSQPRCSWTPRNVPVGDRFGLRRERLVGERFSA